MNRKRLTVVAVLVVALVMAAVTAMAFNAPASGTLGYDFYDYANKLSSGAVGFAIGIGGLATAGFFMFRQQVMPAAGCIFGVITILKATSIVTSLGLII